MRLVREAQAITQSAIAEKIKQQGEITITQGAITQFEKMKISISTAKMIKIAPLLNLNPEFIESGVGNPFKQHDMERIIMMFLPDDPFGKPDFNLIREIASYNRKAHFVFIKPFYSSKEVQKFIKRAGWKPLAYALLIKDDDKNIFFFRRQRKSTFLDQRELRTLILENTSHDTVRFDEYPITERESKSQLYIEIMRDNVDSRSIRNLFGVTLLSRERELRAKERADRNLKRDFLLDITTRIGDYERSAHESDTLGKIEEIIIKMNDDEIEHFLKQLMPKISNSIRKFLRL